jgi:hypothetical protein
MITKVIFPDAYDFGQPAVSLVGFSTKGMEKRAALFDQDVPNIQKKANRAYLHVITTGAGEHYGPNQNGDNFNERPYTHIAPLAKTAAAREFQLDGGLMKYHDETYKKHGGVFHNHQNKHTKTASSGEIEIARYNEPMHRGELLIGVDEKDWAPQLQKLANGKPVYLSMACDVPFDVASCCHHIRKVAEDKCEHVKNGLLMLTKEGHQISLLNDRPVFHDISEVFKPADKIAFTLRKVASQGVRSSDEIASEMGIPGLILPLEIQKKANGGKPGALARRLELLCKLAKIEKTIEAKINPGDEAAKLAFSPEGGFGDIDDKTVSQLREKDPSAVFGAARRGMVLLPVDVFLKLLTGDRFGSDIAPMMPSVRASMGGVFGRMADSGSSCCDDAAYEPENVPDRGLEDIVGGLMGSHSLAPEPTRVRIIKVVMRKKPDGHAAMPKEAVSKLRTAASDYLAGEYAKYALAFLDGMPEDKARLTVAYTTGYSQV